MDCNFELQHSELDTLKAIYGQDNILKIIQLTPTIRATLEIPCHFQTPQKIRIFTKKYVRTSLDSEKLQLDFIFTEFSLNYLPPIILEFEFPNNYPSNYGPSFHLTSKWLNFSQLSKLCRKLDTIWYENRGGTVLFDWFQFLTNDLFQFLDIQFPYTLNLEYPKESHDLRAIQDGILSSDLLEIVEHFNTSKLYEEFCQQQHYCAICMEYLPGTKCLQIRPCQHSFCKICLSKYLSTKIQEFSISILQCPQGNCNSLINNQILSQSVNKDLYARYDEFLFKRALEEMEDIVYCPLTICGSPSELQMADKSMAICLVCKYCFCPKCRRVYHGVSPCVFSKDKFKEIIQEYKQGNSMKKAFLERKYGKSVLEQMSSDIEDELWLQKNTKKCPKCKIHIEKIFGCSKVTLDEAKPHWINLYTESLTKCKHRYLHGQCKLDSTNSPCEVGLRSSTKYVLSGSVLGVWSHLCKSLASDVTGNFHIQVVRIYTTNLEREVGILIPPGRVDILRETLEKVNLQACGDYETITVTDIGTNEMEIETMDLQNENLIDKPSSESDY
ncbi:E3 ubiquitin-protein ligase RNF14 [Oopsacas minuta]|uniref:RBR-type E3 ubiquitin transferase n=1 Tax=Oopsacas minuta TaxID=111878 RepID=A0AAV7KCM0_9METZ|nr:E3 ubiquitin-protein ligase RNF14 [Oopsacas minuta]